MILLSILSKCFLVLLVMFSHELGHILIARRSKIRVRKIGFNWMGMYIQRERGNGWPEIATCVAGAAMNFMLASLFWSVNNWFALCNLTFALVNLLPISHSDGVHAWQALCAMRTEERN